ncbi:hypothetical protein [Thioalkalivibrio sp. HK1]|uniref:hypothetical protein n=1 Tax=Thioalkalivibrio sp. HK1 TaxID=1469245 RepID=UPI001E610E59|nr:hypothetical protein [Thioalkalivibrio sp. HK1]
MAELKVKARGENSISESELEGASVNLIDTFEAGSRFSLTVKEASPFSVTLSEELETTIPWSASLTVTATLPVTPV